MSGRWSGWTRSDDDDRIERGWHLGGLDWTGAADAIRFRTTGQVTRLRAYYVSSPVDGISPRRLEVAGSPLVISRFSWQADESIRRHAPRYADRVHRAAKQRKLLNDSAARSRVCLGDLSLNGRRRRPKWAR